MSTEIELKTDEEIDDCSSATQSEIRDAYKVKDTEKSRQLHQLKMRNYVNTMSLPDDDIYFVEINQEQDAHKSFGEYVKYMIYGGLDGVITTFAIVTGIEGANFPSETILVLGFANLIADAISMGIGDYLSEKSEIEYIDSERQREEWEFENFKEGEIQEMIQIYIQKGVTKTDAELILRTMSKYRDFFINHMMIQELELYPFNGDDKPVKGGFITLISFLCFGCVPLLSYVALQDIKIHENTFDPRFIISVLLSIVALFGLGIFKGKVTESSITKSSIIIITNGILAAGAAYLIALALSHLTGIRGDG